ncbi:MAG: PDZ domain-containing protein [Acidimicrobiales bacterium]|nr:PDZ domain-containing protein [Acidimicrobiales bacterium]
MDDANLTPSDATGPEPSGEPLLGASGMKAELGAEAGVGPAAPAGPAGSTAGSGLGELPSDVPRMMPAPPPDPVDAFEAEIFTVTSPPVGPLPSPPPSSLPAPNPADRSFLPPPSEPASAPVPPLTPPRLASPPAPLGPVQLPLHGPEGLAASGPTIEHPLAPKRSPRTDSRKGLVLLGVLAALLGLGLLATGYAFARATDDDTPTQAAPDGGALISSTPADNPIMPSPLDGESPEPVAAVASTVLPSVVLINTGIGQGSGIVYNDTLIVTNAHVVGEAGEVDVQLADGSIIDGTVIGTDPGRDIAVVQVGVDSGAVPAVFAPSETVRVGQLAVALGSPFGLDQTVTSGVVSAVGRVIPAGLTGENLVAMVQTDAPINPGNSGGALADREGRIVGMNTAIRTETGTFSGVGFAIPSDTIILIVERIVAGESLETGFLGVGLDNSTTGTVGALITDVVDGSPADLAGIRAGDVVVKLGSQIIDDRSDLAAAIRLRSPGAKIELEVVRDGEPFSTTVTLGES